MDFSAIGQPLAAKGLERAKSAARRAEGARAVASDGAQQAPDSDLGRDRAVEVHRAAAVVEDDADARAGLLEWEAGESFEAERRERERSGRRGVSAASHGYWELALAGTTGASSAGAVSAGGRISTGESPVAAAIA